ncbi:MAG: hypothetical protein ACD_44C00125G0004 [uncultured bacterium]|nr:MAG: hypothetical protein ACD_44C00125G0004 [uncultured bacterium]
MNADEFYDKEETIFLIILDVEINGYTLKDSCKKAGISVSMFNQLLAEDRARQEKNNRDSLFKLEENSKRIEKKLERVIQLFDLN